MPTTDLPYDFYFFIGNSGAGKDTTMKLFELNFREYGISVMNLKRVITRKNHSSEDFISVSVPEFKEMVEKDIFEFYWKIYDNFYGYRKEDISHCIENKKIGLFNISRAIIPVIEKKYPLAKFVHVTAPQEESRSRILDRGRGDPKNDRKRIERMSKNFNIPEDAIEIDNSSTLSELQLQVKQLITKFALHHADIVM